MAWLVARQRGAGRAADRECRSSAPSGLDHYWVGEMEGGGGVAPPPVSHGGGGGGDRAQASGYIAEGWLHKRSSNTHLHKDKFVKRWFMIENTAAGPACTESHHAHLNLVSISCPNACAKAAQSASAAAKATLASRSL